MSVVQAERRLMDFSNEDPAFDITETLRLSIESLRTGGGSITAPIEYAEAYIYTDQICRTGFFRFLGIIFVFQGRWLFGFLAFVAFTWVFVAFVAVHFTSSAFTVPLSSHPLNCQFRYGRWLFGFLAFWLFGFLAFWLFGFLAFWLFGFLAFGGFLALAFRILMLFQLASCILSIASSCLGPPPPPFRLKCTPI